MKYRGTRNQHINCATVGARTGPRNATCAVEELAQEVVDDEAAIHLGRWVCDEEDLPPGQGARRPR